MRDKNECKIDRLGCGPFNSGSRQSEFTAANDTGENTRAARLCAEPAAKKTAGMLGAGVVASLVASLLLMLGMLAVPTPSYAQVAIGISVNFGPPAIPVYAQPMCPGPNYVWTPGYWAWDPDYGYYWVPGTWVPAPFVGALWTPGYWGYNGGMYFWHAGYWGTVVGFYGGINYGYGYTGFGYYGGYWNHDRFYYNRDVNNIRINNIRYYYNRRVENVRDSRVSYNGGPGGINARPTRRQLDAARSRRFGALREQEHQRDFARNDPAQRASFNRGRPSVAATPRPGEFRARGAERATRTGAPYREPARRAAPVERRNNQQFRSFGQNEQQNRNVNRNRQQNQNFNRNEQQNRNFNRNDQQFRNANRNEQHNRNFNRNQQQNQNFNAGRNERATQRSMPQARPQQENRSMGHGSPQRCAPPSHQERGGGGNEHGNNGHGHGGRGR